MHAYPDCYLNEIVETQGKLFEYVADNPSVDFDDFIQRYMKGKTRSFLDRADAYLSNLDAKELSRPETPSSLRGMERMVRRFSVTSSPVRPSPRVAPFTKTPFS